MSGPGNKRSRGHKPDPHKMELRVRMLLRNGLTSKSGMTLADTEVLKEIAVRLGYDPKILKQMDITDESVNPFVRM